MSVNASGGDDVAIKLSNLEGLMLGMSQRFTRIEEQIDRVITLDRTVAEINVRNEGLQRDLRDLTHELKNMAASNKAAHEVLALHVANLEKAHLEFKNKTSGALLTLKLFSGACAFILVVCGSWVYERAEWNRNTNIEQNHQIEQLKNRLDRKGVSSV